MLKKLNTKQAQSTIEYVTIIIIVIGAFLSIQNYAKRGLQGRWKQSVDQIGEQYDPRVMDTNIRHTTTVNTDTDISIIPTESGFWTMRSDTTNSVETKTGYSAVGAY